MFYLHIFNKFVKLILLIGFGLYLQLFYFFNLSFLSCYKLIYDF